MQDVKDRDLNPPDLPEDTRKVWVHLPGDEAMDIATDFMDLLFRTTPHLAQYTWKHAMTECATTRSMADYIGRIFCKANSEAWVYE